MQQQWASVCASAHPVLLAQVGLNGVDNGAIRFTHVRVPRENLLDRFASVDCAGEFIVMSNRL